MNRSGGCDFRESYIDPKVVPRSVASFIADDIFIGGNIVDHEGDTWIEQAGRLDRFLIGR
ncbi:MAG: hypothetical protein HOH37_04405 [Gammaproteobacteria bacterium]|nr:hypothetical protein [Gammaproteobacteria bacterium]